MFKYIENIFPIPVVCYERVDNISQEEKNLVESYSNKIKKNFYNKITEDYYVLNNPPFKNLKKFIDNSIKDYIDKVISPRNNIEVYITESWINFNTRGEHHHTHIHPNSYLSGTFYFNTIKNDGLIFYRNENFIDIEQKDYNMYNAPAWTVPIKTNQLFLFPSNAKHGVNENNEDNTRICLAFNCFIKGQISKHLGKELII